MMGVDAVRDWTKTLVKASYKDFVFETEREGVDDAGRLVALHQFVKAEGHATEDLGRKARRFTVSAYIVGNLADARARLLVETCSSPGVGLLVLPMTGDVLVRCIGCSTTNEKRALGYVGFSLQFVEAGLEAGGFPAIRIGDRIAEEVLSSLPDIVGHALSSRTE